MSNQKETIRFSTSVAAGDTETLTKTMQAAGTVEHVDVRFYSGPDLSFEVFPFAAVGDPDDRERQALVETIGRSALVGDGDDFVFESSQGFEQDDVLGVELTNDSDVADPDGVGYTYDAHVDVTVDYAGGSSRSILAMLREVFA